MDVNMCLRNARELFSNHNIAELMTEVEHRIYDVQSLTAETKELLYDDVRDILADAGVTGDDVHNGIVQLSAICPYDWYHDYDIPTPAVGAWLYLYTDGAKNVPTKELLVKMRNFTKDKSVLSLSRYDELVSIKMFDAYTKPDDALRQRALAKFRSVKVIDAPKEEQAYYKQLLHKEHLEVEQVIKRACEIPRKWLKQYKITTMAQAGWLMERIHKEGKVTENMLNMLSMLHNDDSAYAVDESAELFISLCCEHDLDMNIGPFSIDDDSAQDDCMITVTDYAKRVFGSSGIDGCGKVLSAAFECKRDWYMNTALDIMYMYVSMADAQNIGKNICDAGSLKLTKNSYSAEDVYTLLGYLVNVLDVPETHMASAVSQAIDDKII